MLWLFLPSLHRVTTAPSKPFENEKLRSIEHVSDSDPFLGGPRHPLHKLPIFGTPTHTRFLDTKYTLMAGLPPEDTWLVCINTRLIKA